MKNLLLYIVFSILCINIHAQSSYDSTLVSNGIKLLNENKYSDGVSEFKKACTVNSNDAQTWYYLGLAYTLLKKLDSAEISIQKSLSLNPFDPNCHLILANIMDASGKKTKTTLALLNFLLLEPNGVRAKNAIDALKVILLPSRRGIMFKVDSTSDNIDQLDFSVSLLIVEYTIDHPSSTNPNLQLKSDLETLIEMVATQKAVETPNIWWKFYGRYFRDLHNKQFDETFVNYILQETSEKIISRWLNKNKGKVSELINWNNTYSRN